MIKLQVAPWYPSDIPLVISVLFSGISMQMQHARKVSCWVSFSSVNLEPVEFQNMCYNCSIFVFRLSGDAPFMANSEDDLFELIKKGNVKFPPAKWKDVSQSGWLLSYFIRFTHSVIKNFIQERLNAKRNFLRQGIVGWCTPFPSVDDICKKSPTYEWYREKWK